MKLHAQLQVMSVVINAEDKYSNGVLNYSLGWLFEGHMRYCALTGKLGVTQEK